MERPYRGLPTLNLLYEAGRGNRTPIISLEG